MNKLNFLLVLTLPIFIACNNIKEKGSANKAETLPDSLGFTNKAEAKNKIVNGLREGKWLAYSDTIGKNESDTIVSDTNAPHYLLGVYHGGKLNGLVRAYYKSGKLLSETYYSNGKMNGTERGYYENGILMYEGTNINGKANGVHKEYDESGKLEMEALFSNDSMHLEKDYDDGILVRVTPVTFSNKDSMGIDGVQKDYYKDGKLKEETPYVNSKMNGVDKGYYESGKIKFERPFKNDKINGIQKKYYESGKLESEAPFNNNTIGVIKNYNENGTLKEGKEKEYMDSDFETTQDSKAPYYKITSYKAGVPYGIEKWYYKSGKLESEVPYAQGKENGVIKEYYESGKLEYERPYKNGKKNGIEKRYYENGIVTRETPFINDEVSGIEKRYYESGKLESTTSYTNDEEGITKNYDKNGNEIK